MTTLVSFNVLGKQFIGSALVVAAWTGLIFSISVKADEVAFTAPLETLSQLTERPLFSTTRRGRDSTVQTPTPIESAPTLPLEGVLLGLAKGDDNTGFAIIKLNDEATPVKIQIGDVIRGWQLISVDNHTASFSKESQTLSLAFP